MVGSSSSSDVVTRAHAAQVLASNSELFVVVLNGAVRGERKRVEQKLTIGKATDNGLVLTDDTVSRHHCELERTEQGLLIRDLGSTNGTRVGHTTVREALVELGSIITVGNVELLLRADSTLGSIAPSTEAHFGDAVGPSLCMRSIFGVLERVAPTDAAVLLEGETGTGKEVLARAIHDCSQRKAQPFLVVDCGAISYNLIESELFGHERGAFTGAISTRSGAFELAGNGTIFLDEVGELPLDFQPKLLRVLESGEFRRVGGNKQQQSGARIIVATKRNLRTEVERGKFREDLYFRLAVVPITLPPLRTRREDIPVLVERFLDAAQKRSPRPRPLTLKHDALSGLMAHDWPGNVRELRNVLDRAIYLASSSGEAELRLMDLPTAASIKTPNSAFGPFVPERSYRETRTEFENDFERRYVAWLLGRHQGNISAASREAKMDRKHLFELARKHGLRGGDRGPGSLE